MKLRQKLLVLILLPVILLTALSGYYAYYTARQLLQNQIYRTDQFKSAEYSAKINEQLLKYENGIKELAAVVSSPEIRQTDLNALVKAAAKADTDFSNVMFIFVDGRYISSNGVALPPGFDVRSVEWYKHSMASDGAAAQYSEPYKDVLYVIKDISQVLRKMIGVTRYLAEGDFRENPRSLVRKDEFGEMADALVEMRTKIRLVLERISGAGEQGKGFAVVAEEVRKLAEQSQEASGHIAELIRQIQMKTEEAVESMNSGTKEVAGGNEAVEGTGRIFK